MPKVIEDRHRLTLNFPIKELEFGNKTTLSRILNAVKKHFPNVPETQLEVRPCNGNLPGDIVMTVRPSLEFARRNIEPLDENGKKVLIGNKKKH